MSSCIKFLFISFLWINQKSERHPDFKHKETGEALWLDSSPKWVLPKLPPLKEKQEAYPIQKLVWWAYSTGSSPFIMLISDNPVCSIFPFMANSQPDFFSPNFLLYWYFKIGLFMNGFRDIFLKKKIWSSLEILRQ